MDDDTPPDLGSARFAATTLVPALAYARACAAAVEQHHLTCPTPCESWDVGQVMAHLVQSLETLTGYLGAGAPRRGGPAPGEPQAADLRARLAAVATSLVAVAGQWRAAPLPLVGGLPISRGKVLHVAAIEAAVHGWDVAAGAGVVAPFDDDLASRLGHDLADIVNSDTRLGSFGPPMPVMPSDAPLHRLLAALGRDPAWAAGSRKR